MCYLPEYIDSWIHVPWIVGACVDIIVMAWKEINIMEDEALHLFGQLLTLHKPYVEQLGSVEQFLLALLHHHNSGMKDSCLPDHSKAAFR